MRSTLPNVGAHVKLSRIAGRSFYLEYEGFFAEARYDLIFARILSPRDFRLFEHNRSSADIPLFRTVTSRRC